MTKEGGNSLPHKQETWGGQGSSVLLSFCLSCLSWRILSLPAWPKLAGTLTLHPGVWRTSRYLLRIWPWSYCSVAKLCLTLWDPVDCSQAPLSFTISPSLLTFVSIESMMPSNHLTLSPPSPPAINLSQHQVFSRESALHIRWPKYWSFSISPSNEKSGLISLRIYWFDLLAVQETLKRLLQHQIPLESINSSALSLLYGPTLTSVHDYWKT